LTANLTVPQRQLPLTATSFMVALRDS
jgi:hypothetical protein